MQEAHLYIISISLIGFGYPWTSAGTSSGVFNHYQYIATGGVLTLPVLLMILLRKKYPKWWFDWNLAFVKFGYRVSAYFALLRDEYPSTDEDQAVHVDITYPNASQLMRGMPLVKWFLAIPHIIVLVFLYISVIISVFISWLTILFTGHYPKGLFDFVVGVFRWSVRVLAYAVLLVTDKYPPFTLKA